MSTHPDDTQAAAVIVCTVIYPGKMVAVGSIGSSPSAIIKITPEQLEALTLCHAGRKPDLLNVVKQTIQVEAMTWPIEADRIRSEQRTAVHEVDQNLQTAGQRLQELEEVDKHTLGDENTPSDHYYRS